MSRDSQMGESSPAGRYGRPVLACILIFACVSFSIVWIEEPILRRANIVASVCLALWLTEVVPPYVPTFVLWALTPVLLHGFGDQFQLTRVLGWSANPVLALFLGGFALSVAASRYGIDSLIARLAVRLSRGSKLLLLVLTVTATASLSMWMSNIAAAAIMITALHPLFTGVAKRDPFRCAFLMGIALGANFGGMATPIGTGPNAIAIAAISSSHAITFIEWMVFALPLASGLMIAGVLLLIARFHVRGATTELPDISVKVPDRRGGLGFQR